MTFCSSTPNELAPTALAAADFTRDGNLDVVAYDGDKKLLSVLFGDGNYNLTLSTTMTLRWRRLLRSRSRRRLRDGLVRFCGGSRECVSVSRLENLPYLDDEPVR